LRYFRRLRCRFSFYYFLIKYMFWIFIGILATLVTSVQFTPQVVKAFKTKSVKDVSLLTFIIICISASLWLFYGIHLKDPFLITTNSLVFISSVLVVISKFLFK